MKRNIDESDYFQVVGFDFHYIFAGIGFLCCISGNNAAITEAAAAT